MADSTPSGTQNAGQSPQAERAEQPRWSWLRFTRNALIIVLLAVGAFLLIEKSIIPNLVPKNFGVVREGAIYRSGELTPASFAKVVREHNIKTVVDLGAHTEGTPEEARAQASADALGVTRHRFFLHGDGTGNPDRYLAALRVMTDPDAQPVLVHCAAGAQRTSGAVVLYRCLIEGADFEAAYAEASNFEHDPDDNPKLRPMLETWIDPIERAYREGGQVERGD